MIAPALVQAESFDKVKIAAGKMLFDGSCHRCHSVDADRKSFGVLEADGKLNEHPPFTIRHD